MKQLIFSLCTLFSSLALIGQSVVTNGDIVGKQASEGDFYIGSDAPIGQIYIGVKEEAAFTGNYKPFYTKSLISILTNTTTAGGFNISNLSDPTNPQDAATKIYVDTKLSGNIFSNDGSITSTRILNGTSSYSLDYTGLKNYTINANNINMQSVNSIDINASTNTILNNNTSILSNLSVNGSLIDSFGSPGTIGQLLSSTLNGTKWVSPSTIPKELKYYTAESPTGEEKHSGAKKTIYSHQAIIINEPSIVDIEYSFRFFKPNKQMEGRRITYVQVSDGTGLLEPYLIPSSVHPDSYPKGNTKIALIGKCDGSKKLLLNSGTYVFDFITLGDIDVTTGNNSFNTAKPLDEPNYTGWTFDILVSPINY